MPTDGWASRYYPEDSGQIHLVERGSGPLLLFAHATGMCARAYTPMLAPLADRFRVAAFDARAHGRTSLARKGVDFAEWLVFRDDLARLVEALGERPAVLAGHSFGATVAALACAAQPGLAETLVLLDPAFIPARQATGWRGARDSGNPPPNPMAERALRRRASFPSRAAAAAAWRGRGVFAGWPEEAFSAHLADALAPDESGGVRLSCAPEDEAAIFHGVCTRLEHALAALCLPTLLLAAEAGTVPPGFEREDAARWPAVRAERLAGTGHFFPVTHPGLVQDRLAGMGQGARPAR